MKFSEILFDTITEEVKNKKFFDALMTKWRTEKLDITDEEGENILKSFSDIQDGLRPDIPQVFTFLTRYDGNHGYSKFDPNNLKQIGKYSLAQLLFLLKEYGKIKSEKEKDVFSDTDTKPTPEKIQASKELWFGDKNKIFDKDGLRVYDIKDQQMSIRYGYYYHVIYKNLKGNPNESDREIQPWCVTWRKDMNKTNMWGSYRNDRSFYFIIDENKTPTSKYYMSALQRDSSVSSGFRITSLLNDGDTVKYWSEIEELYPQLKGEKDLFIVKKYNTDELTVKDIVGQINEQPNNRYEFKRMDKTHKEEYIDGGGILRNPESWKSMDKELRNKYILYPGTNQYNVRDRFSNFLFLDEIKKVGNEFNLLDKSVPGGVANIYDYLMKNEFKVARISADNKKIRMYESKNNGKNGLYDVKISSWVNHDGITYEPFYVQTDTDYYQDYDNNVYVVEIFSKNNQESTDSFYSIYLFSDENPEFDSHFLSHKSWEKLKNELTPTDGSEPPQKKPKEYTDIK